LGCVNDGGSMTTETLHLGVVGLGRGFSVMIPTFALHPKVTLAAACDPRQEALERFSQDFGGTSYSNYSKMCADDRLDAIYVCSPHQFHEEHVVAAAKAGKHILVEKPMALNIDSCSRMIEAAHAAGVHLIVGHSHSFDAPILEARRIIESGSLGAPKMISALNCTDFIYRPRRPEELDTSKGGGVIFSQGAHQIDITRLIAGGMATSVYACTGNWDETRPTEGAYSALVRFENDLFANLTYNGYGGFDSDLFTNWIGEMGRKKDPDNYGTARKTLASLSGPKAEEKLKAARAYGGPEGTELPESRFMEKKTHEHFGMFLISCENGDLRPLPDRLEIYAGVRETIKLPPPKFPRAEVIEELHGAIFEDKAPLHTGEWGRATLEVCLAIIESARTKEEITLSHQVALSLDRAEKS
jgi:phthalate 4,5-cis-dihydrodiol dehydrogenase